MVETFNPDNVLLSEKTDGTFYDGHELQILEGLNKGSAVAKLGHYVEMGGERQKDFVFNTGDEGGGYWVGEGKKVKTAKNELVEARLVSKKLARNIIVSREVLDFTWSEFFEQYKGQIIETFNRAIDEAVIQGKENPFENSVESVVEAKGNKVEEGITLNSVLEAVDLVYDGNVEPNGVVSTRRNRKFLRNAVDGANNTVYDRVDNTLDGLPVVDVSSVEQGDLYVGDFSKLYFGIPKGIEFNILTESTISDVKGSDGQPINLGERQLVAIQPTLHFAALVVKDDAFAKVTPNPL